VKPRALVLLAPGTNRDRDVLEAIELAGGEGHTLPLSAIGAGKTSLLDFDLLVVPGGFSYGDALGAGRLLALDFAKRFAGEVEAFAASGRPLLGICNGFQALVKAGILPGSGFLEPERSVTLASNANGRFECRWVRLAAPSSSSFWTEGLEEGFHCPIAHGEGRLAVDGPATLDRLFTEARAALVYTSSSGFPAGGQWPENPNGSAGDIAGLCNEAGNVLGLMPHPENAILPRQVAGLPGREGGGALKLFQNGLRRAAAG
jgi:phosphoribosylformylglycinamidine synthase